MVDRLIEFLNKTDGRDKICKVIQFGSRYCKVLAEGKDKDTKQMFANLQGSMADARKLFRLLKSLLEYQKIQKLLKEKRTLKKKN